MIKCQLYWKFSLIFSDQDYVLCFLHHRLGRVHGIGSIHIIHQCVCILLLSSHCSLVLLLVLSWSWLQLISTVNNSLSQFLCDTFLGTKLLNLSIDSELYVMDMLVFIAIDIYSCSCIPSYSWNWCFLKENRCLEVSFFFLCKGKIILSLFNVLRFWHLSLYRRLPASVSFSWFDLWVIFGISFSC